MSSVVPTALADGNDVSSDSDPDEEVKTETVNVAGPKLDLTNVKVNIFYVFRVKH